MSSFCSQSQASWASELDPQVAEGVGHKFPSVIFLGLILKVLVSCHFWTATWVNKAESSGQREPMGKELQC